MPFPNAWAQIQQIAIGTHLPNWTVDHGYQGNPVTIIDIGPQHVTFHSVTAIREQRVSINDFQAVYDIWHQYVAGQFERHLIRDDITRHSRLIINTFKWLCDQNNNILP